jgi:hypothetical protein
MRGRDLDVVALCQRQCRLVLDLIDDALTHKELPVRGEFAVGVRARVVLEDDLVTRHEIVVLIGLVILGVKHGEAHRHGDACRQKSRHEKTPQREPAWPTQVRTGSDHTQARVGC